MGILWCGVGPRYPDPPLWPRDSIPHALTYTDSKENLRTRDVELMEVRDPLSPGVICQDGSVILVSYRRSGQYGQAVLRYNEMEHEMIPPLDP
eukprot:827917-Amorphochlora_amoeboformis.AAC.1